MQEKQEHQDKTQTKHSMESDPAQLRWPHHTAQHYPCCNNLDGSCHTPEYLSSSSTALSVCLTVWPELLQHEAYVLLTSPWVLACQASRVADAACCVHACLHWVTHHLHTGGGVVGRGMVVACNGGTAPGQPRGKRTKHIVRGNIVDGL